jgi:hypothetical protein
MKKAHTYPVVALNHFIEATRDSGYKNTTSAIAELVDNSFEAMASVVEIKIDELSGGTSRKLQLSVIDNGVGMMPSVLRLALQFGGSTRFNSRCGVGRYGMGLPNSSLSQARRVDVYSWTTQGIIWWTYLDVDEIASGLISYVPQPKRARLNVSHEPPRSPTGTAVIWSKCDRLNHRKVKTLVSKLQIELGRIFRRQILQGKVIKINGEVVQLVDPLFLVRGNNLVGAMQYGPTLSYEVALPNGTNAKCSSTIHITFTELPIVKWHAYSNEEKRRFGISKNAGVSIVRSDREIDYGWFFMGSKRKENYDDWWRCEVRFDAQLDELFGVTHTKQGIHPTDEIISILAPDIERVAHELNGRVRRKFLEVKGEDTNSEAQSRAESRDYLLEPLVNCSASTDLFSKYNLGYNKQTGLINKKIFPGMVYRIEHKVLTEMSFYVPLASDHEVVILLNKEHPFYEHIYTPVAQAAISDKKVFRRLLELLLLSAARAECSMPSEMEKACASSLRQAWGNVLAAFLT